MGLRNDVLTVALSVVVCWVVFVSGPVVTEACPVLKDYACVRRMREEELARFLPLSLSRGPLVCGLGLHLCF